MLHGGPHPGLLKAPAPKWCYALARRRPLRCHKLIPPFRMMQLQCQQALSLSPFRMVQLRCLQDQLKGHLQVYRFPFDGLACVIIVCNIRV